MKLDLGVDISYMLAWRDKKKGFDFFERIPGGSYNKLPAYLYTLGISYPRSRINLQKTYEDRLLYLFVALDPFIKGFDIADL